MENIGKDCIVKAKEVVSVNKKGNYEYKDITVKGKIKGIYTVNGSKEQYKIRTENSLWYPIDKENVTIIN